MGACRAGETDRPPYPQEPTREALVTMLLGLSWARVRVRTYLSSHSFLLLQTSRVSGQPLRCL